MAGPMRGAKNGARGRGKLSNLSKEAKETSTGKETRSGGRSGRRGRRSELGAGRVREKSGAGPQMQRSFRGDVEGRDVEEDDSDTELANLDVGYEYEGEVAQEEKKSNRRFDDVDVYEYELPEDFEVLLSLCDLHLAVDFVDRCWDGTYLNRVEGVDLQDKSYDLKVAVELKYLLSIDNYRACICLLPSLSPPTFFTESSASDSWLYVSPGRMRRLTRRWRSRKRIRSSGAGRLGIVGMGRKKKTKVQAAMLSI